MGPKPQFPSMSGRQYADDSMTPEPLSVTYDPFANEIAADRPMHTDTTPGEGKFNFAGKQYSEDWMGGNKEYGVDVKPSGPSRESMDVNVGAANRGNES